MENTKTLDFTTSFLVNAPASQVFAAVTNPRGWWSEAIVGGTSAVGDVFDYHYEDLHRCKMEVIEVEQDRKVVWLVLENTFKFTQDQSEWVGNHIVFEIAQVGAQTQLQFTQVGLVPAYECFAICQDAWTNYIQNSLRSLIETGAGMPNGKGKPQNAHEVIVNAQDYHTHIAVNASAEAAFQAIQDVSAWWSTHFEGSTAQVGDQFTVTFGQTWITSQVAEIIPGKKIMWQVVDCFKHWLKDKKEWKGTWMIWEISEQDGAAKIDFTHVGLVPGIECYNGCEKAWDFYVQESLLGLLNEGAGMPEK